MAWPAEPTEDAVALGGDFWYAVGELDGEMHGIQLWHPRPDNGQRCWGGWIPVTGEYRWDVVSREPLTLNPSILCNACGAHGWIREGKWVSA